MTPICRTLLLDVFIRTATTTSSSWSAVGRSSRRCGYVSVVRSRLPHDAPQGPDVIESVFGPYGHRLGMCDTALDRRQLRREHHHGTPAYWSQINRTMYVWPKPSSTDSTLNTRGFRGPHDWVIAGGPRHGSRRRPPAAHPHRLLRLLARLRPARRRSARSDLHEPVPRSGDRSPIRR